MIEDTELNDLIVDAIRDRKGTGITLVDLSDIPGASARAFIIAEGAATTQVSAIAERLRERLRDDADLKPFNSDGDHDNSEWIVLDYGDVWVHIFLPETRRRYNLEELWNDAKITEYPDLD